MKTIQRVQTRKGVEAGTNHKLVTAQLKVNLGSDEEKIEYSSKVVMKEKREI